ncbi:MAG: hypothetical protein CG445_88, partial [Methanosaeta sp. ASM2]
TSRLARKCLKRSTHLLGNIQALQQIIIRLVTLQQVRMSQAGSLEPQVNK